MNLDFGKNKVTDKRKLNIENYIRKLLEVYDLKENNFRIKFRKMWGFGILFPDINVIKRKVSIGINEDLLKEKKFEELKGTLAHEFAHFYHYKNFSIMGGIKFLLTVGIYHYSRLFSNGKWEPFTEFLENYEQYTDLTAMKFQFGKELIALKKYSVIYRKNLPKNKIPRAENYLDAKFLSSLKNQNQILKEMKKRHKIVNVKSLI